MALARVTAFSASWESLKALGVSAATSHSVALFHAVGRTPEAPTEKAAFEPKNIGASQVFEFGHRELKQTIESLSDDRVLGVDLV